MHEQEVGCTTKTIACKINVMKPRGVGAWPGRIDDVGQRVPDPRLWAGEAAAGGGPAARARAAQSLAALACFDHYAAMLPRSPGPAPAEALGVE